MKFNTFIILFFCAASMFGQVSSSISGSSSALQPTDTTGTVMPGSSQLPTGNAVQNAIAAIPEYYIGNIQATHPVGGQLDLEGNEIADATAIYLNTTANDAFSWEFSKPTADLYFSYQSREYRLNAIEETHPNDLTTKGYVDKAIGESEALNANTTISSGTPKIKKIFGGNSFALDIPNWQTGEVFILRNFSLSDVTLTITGSNIVILGSFYNSGRPYILSAGQEIEIELPTAGGIAYSITAPSVQAATNNFANSYTLEKEILGFASGKQDNTSTIQARNCTISKISTGRYQVKFFEPHPDGTRYEVLFGATEDNNADVPKVWVEDGSETPDGLIIRVSVDDNGTAGDIARDDIFSFSINYIKAILTNGD